MPSYKFSYSLLAYYMFSNDMFGTLDTENEIEILLFVEQGKSPLFVNVCKLSLLVSSVCVSI